MEVDRGTLEATYCWEQADVVPRRPQMTAFRRTLRYHQSRWREANGHPIGSQPIVPRSGKPARPLGSRLPLDYARATGANFLSPAIRAAVEARLAVKERHQMLDVQRLWADLLSSMATCCNLFGDLAADLALASRAVQTWWPGSPGEVVDVRFAHSPGRLDPAYLGNLSAFDAAVVLDLGAREQGIIGVEARYHEYAKAETAKPTRLARYREVAETSGVFVADVADRVNGTSLLELWLGHLLVLSMLQHVDGGWGWGRFVVVYPAGNSDLAEVCGRYRELLVEPSTFVAVTLEELLAAGALPDVVAAAFRQRYLPTDS